MLITSPHIDEIAAALAKAQAVMNNAAKDALNPAFRSRYADIASVRAAIQGPLSAVEIAVIQAPGLSATGAVTVETRLAHSSGQWFACIMTATPRDGSPQAIGSAVTYLRRYGLMAMAGIAPDDDDDGDASSRAPSAAPPPRATSPEDAAARRASHHPTWAANKAAFFARISQPDIDATYADVCAVCERMGRPRPSQLDPDSLQRLTTYLTTERGKAALRSPTPCEGV